MSTIPMRCGACQCYPYYGHEPATPVKSLKMNSRLHEIRPITRLLAKNKQFVLKKYDCKANKLEKFNSPLPFVLSNTPHHIEFNNFQLEIAAVPEANLWRAWLDYDGRDDYYCEQSPDALFLNPVGDDLNDVITISQWFQFRLQKAGRAGAIILLGAAITQLYMKLKYTFDTNDMDKIFNAIGVIPEKSQFFLIDPAIPLHPIPANSQDTPLDLSIDLYGRIVEYLQSMMLSR